MGSGCHLSMREVDKGGLVRWENLGRELGKEAELVKMPNQGSSGTLASGLGHQDKGQMRDPSRTFSACLFLLSLKSPPLSQLVLVMFVPASWTSSTIWESVRDADVWALSPDLLNRELWG